MRNLLFAVFLSGCATTTASTIQTNAATPPPPPNPECPKALGKVLESGPVFGVIVEKLCVVGASENQALRVREAIAPREGSPLTAEAVRADIESLFMSDLFTDVTVTAEVMPSKKLMLTYFVTEADIVSTVEFKGVTAVKPDELEALAHKGIRATPFVMKAVTRQLEALYAGLGYARAEVDLKVTSLGKGDAALVVEIAEGARLTVGSVKFEGAKKIPEAELKKALKSAVGSPYLEDLAERDVLSLNTLYFDRGYVNVQVTHEQQTTGDKVELVFKVSEGEQFKLGKLSLSGFSIGDEKEVFKVFESKPKAIFSRATLQRDIERLRERARQRGNLVNVTPLTNVDVNKKLIDITFELVRVSDGTF